MMDIASSIIQESWQVLNESAGYCLFGILMAGLLHAVMPDDFVLRHLGKNNALSVLKASLIGVPLPVCSCGVIPVAMGLRKQGAGTGPTTAFMISTPESGVDSIAITWALLDPLMTVMRPLAAFITATCAGLAVNCLPERPGGAEPEKGCACGGCSAAAPGSHRGTTTAGKMLAGLRFAFTDLLSDIGPSLLLGIFVAGIISALVPQGYIERHLGSGFLPMLMMLAVGIPLYVCASASTPIVAALALKGLSPGAALVFLLAGPATNAATITVVARLMGGRIAAVYVGVIAAVSLLLGLAVNYIYSLAGLNVAAWISREQLEQHSPLAPVFSAALIMLILLSRLPRRSKAPSSRC